MSRTTANSNGPSNAPSSGVSGETSFVQSRRDAIWARGLRIPGPMLGVPMMLVGFLVLAFAWVLQSGWVGITSVCVGGLSLMWGGFVVFGYDRDRT